MEKSTLSNDALFQMLTSIKPVATPCSPEMREWWEKTALPTLKAQALSELHRNDEFKPRIIGFKKNGMMGVVDVMQATRGMFGDVPSKNATAFVHKISAMVPGTYASVFCVEAWALRSNGKESLNRQADKYPNLGDHPDRYEVMMYHMLHYDVDANTMMQLSTMVEVIKVLGADRSRAAWRGTTFGEANITDPNDPKDGVTMTGRFVFGDPENPDVE